MEYIIYISTVFGDIKVRFDVEDMLDNEGEVLKAALVELETSGIINMEKLTAEKLFFEVTQGETRFD